MTPPTIFYPYHRLPAHPAGSRCRFFASTLIVFRFFRYFCGYDLYLEFSNQTFTLMKKWVVYILGIVTGIVLTFAALFIIGFALHSELRGLTIFEKPGKNFPTPENIEAIAVALGIPGHTSTISRRTQTRYSRRKRTSGKQINKTINKTTPFN